jgi:hypothetical protein
VSNVWIGEIFGGKRTRIKKIPESLNFYQILVKMEQGIQPYIITII